MNFSAVAKEKTGPMYSSKEKSGFCSSCWGKNGHIYCKKGKKIAKKIRKKVNIIASGKEKNSLVYNSKAESGFCSSF